MGVVSNSSETRRLPNAAIEANCILLNGRAPRLAFDRGDDETERQGPGREHASRIFDYRAADRPETRSARVLTTVMLTDIVESTRRAAEMGDQQWTNLLDRHDDLAREVVQSYSGVLAKTTGDGVLAAFDAPSGAVRCALALQAAAKRIGLELRIGVHTGEVELRRGDVRGITVHAAARVMRKCAPGEVFVSRIVTDLVAGAGLNFAERGAHELRGLPGRWDLYAARP
jgi:class 3 adenylate cyclase